MGGAELIESTMATVFKIPGISLLDADMSEAMSPDELIEEVAAVIATPVADLLDSTVSVLDLVPMLTAKPWLATRALRDYLTPQGYHLPTRGEPLVGGSRVLEAAERLT